MFTDIVGSTNLVEALGDEAWETMLRWHNTALREVFAAHNGDEISTTGDGFFVSFARRKALRHRSGSACMRPMPRRLAATSTARACMRRPASLLSAVPAT